MVSLNKFSRLISQGRTIFDINRLREQLWLRPFVICLLSILGVLAAKLADGSGDNFIRYIPEIDADALETLLSIMASSMMVIATFSVTSMVSAYASASSTATPRSFKVIIADDASQNALSAFIGAFIFSIVALTALKNDFFATIGVFILFSLTIFVFSIVIITFVRWVDGIARLGRMGSTIGKVESATAKALTNRANAPALHGLCKSVASLEGRPIYANTVGYVQHIDMAALQKHAEKTHARITVVALPGTLVAPSRVLAYVQTEAQTELDTVDFIQSFQIGEERLFDNDPRFGLIVLSEIAGRALSPAVNDPGTAIVILGTVLRLFTDYSHMRKHCNEEPIYNRIAVPELSVDDMFDDIFTVIARDGAGLVEVATRLQKSLSILASSGDQEMRSAAIRHGKLALMRAKSSLVMEEDYKTVMEASGFHEKSVNLS